MTLVDAASPVPSDAELLARVRGGDVHAYGELFDRHRDAAYRLARQLARGHDHDSDDLVAEAFAKVLTVVKSGRGPDVWFRAYLLKAIRHVHVDRIRADRRLQLTDEVEQWESPVPFQDSAVDEFERSAAARAFASLPDRWQMVLWHLDVEGQKPAEVGVLLGLSANGVSALAYRAREGLRTAFLRMHLADTAGDTCRWTIEHLGAYVRSGLSRRDAGKVKDHLVQCPRCAGLYEELAEVNGNLRGLLAPLLLGSAAVAYLQAGTLAGATGSLVSGFTKLVAVLSAPAQAVTAGGTAAATAAAAVTVGVVGVSVSGKLPAGPSAAAPAIVESVGPTGAPLATPSPDGVTQDVPDVPSGPLDSPTGSVSEPPETLRPRGLPGSSPSSLPSPSGSPTVTDPFASPSLPVPPTTSTSTVSPTPTPTPSISPTPTTAPTPTPTDPVPTPTDPAPTTPVPTPPPTSPTPTESPTPTTPPIPTPSGTGSDLSVSMYPAPQDAAGVRVSITVEATSPRSDLLLTVELPPTATAQSQSAEWICSAPLNPSSWSCTAPGDPIPAPLVLIVQPDLQGGQLSATVSAPGNDDPDPSDNTATISLANTATATPSSGSPEPTGASDSARR